MPFSVVSWQSRTWDFLGFQPLFYYQSFLNYNTWGLLYLWRIGGPIDGKICHHLSKSLKSHIHLDIHICELFSFSHSVRFDSLATPWTVAHQSPLSMGFPRQEYWSGLPLSSPGDLPNSGMKWSISCYTWWARNVTALYNSSPPNVNKGSKKGTQFLRPSRSCHTPQWLLRSCCCCC